MKTAWKIQDAKPVEDVRQNGLRYVIRKGATTVINEPIHDYEELKPKKPSFKDFLLNCPKMDEDFTIERQQDYPRRIEL